MKIFNKTETISLPISLNEAWDFLTNPKNLIEITPPEMGFTILSGAEKALFAGQIIQYQVTPLLGIKTKWVSEITQVVDKKYFVDVQLYGPYAMWHHKHFVSEIEGGVLIEDNIDYKIPFGFFGEMLHPFTVAPQLEKIFDFRKKKLIEKFGIIGSQITN
jgi:ligand-binding SRPBCC domain-containing protein